jgi:DNA-binding transcriptional ArsR family regulator
MKGKGSEEEAPKRKLPSQPGDEGISQELLRSVAHPLRRQILRTLHEVGEARSPAELREVYGLPVSHVSYHVKVLRECGAVALTDTRPVRGALEHFYASTVAENESVNVILGSTEEEDEGS